MQRQDIAVGGALTIDGKVLVIRRSQLERSSKGFWEFPKGRVEFGENPEEALRREFLEETNLKINVGDVHKVYSHTYNSVTQPGVTIHFVEIEYLVSLVEGERFDNLKLDKQEHDAWKLVDKDEAQKLDPIYPDRKSSMLSLFDN